MHGDGEDEDEGVVAVEGSVGVCAKGGQGCVRRWLYFVGTLKLQV